MTTDIEARIEELIGNLERNAARVLAALDYVTDELRATAKNGNDPATDFAFALLRGIRERLEETKP